MDRRSDGEREERKVVGIGIGGGCGFMGTHTQHICTQPSNDYVCTSTLSQYILILLTPSSLQSQNGLVFPPTRDPNAYPIRPRLSWRCCPVRLNMSSMADDRRAKDIRLPQSHTIPSRKLQRHWLPSSTSGEMYMVFHRAIQGPVSAMRRRGQQLASSVFRRNQEGDPNLIIH